MDVLVLNVSSCICLMWTCGRSESVQVHELIIGILMYDSHIILELHIIVQIIFKLLNNFYSYLKITLINVSMWYIVCVYVTKYENYYINKKSDFISIRMKL